MLARTGAHYHLYPHAYMKLYGRFLRRGSIVVREREYQNKGVEKSEGDGKRKDEEQEYVKESRKRRDGRGKAVDVA